MEAGLFPAAEPCATRCSVGEEKQRFVQSRPIHGAALSIAIQIKAEGASESLECRVEDSDCGRFRRRQGRLQNNGLSSRGLGDGHVSR